MIGMKWIEKPGNQFTQFCSGFTAFAINDRRTKPFQERCITLRKKLPGFAEFPPTEIKSVWYWPTNDIQYSPILVTQNYKLTSLAFSSISSYPRSAIKFFVAYRLGKQDPFFYFSRISYFFMLIFSEKPQVFGVKKTRSPRVNAIQIFGIPPARALTSWRDWITLLFLHIRIWLIRCAASFQFKGSAQASLLREYEWPLY